MTKTAPAPRRLRIGILLALRAGVLLGLLFNSPGCGEAPRPIAEPAATQPPPPPSTPSAAPTVDSWAKIFLGGKHVGYRHLTIRPAPEPDAEQFELTQRLRITRGGDTIEQTLQQTSVETASGRWLRGKATHGAGGALQEDGYVVEKDLLKVEMRSSGGVTRKAIPWNQEKSGFFAAEASLRRKPLSPGERREFATFFPIFNQPGRVVLTAKEEVEISLAGVAEKAMKIEQEEILGETSTVTHLWVDAAGELLQAEIPALQMRIERATRDAAIAISEGEGFDLLASTLISVSAPKENLHHRGEQRYRITLRDGDPLKSFPERSFQRVTRLDEHTAEITVLRRGPIEEGRPRDPPPTAADSAASPLMNADAPEIVELARSVAAEETDLEAIALALEKRVHSYVETKDFSAALDSASDVLRRKRGDCTEHAVLLAALCRARGIPARCAAGLVYIPSQQAFGFHMWTLAYLQGRWTPLDATLGLGGAAGGHLLLAESPLSEGPDADLFLPVMGVIGKLEIEILEP